jgi:uncharacterized repeat protein (TIGR01451 family)
MDSSVRRVVGALVLGIGGAALPTLALPAAAAGVPVGHLSLATQAVPKIATGLQEPVVPYDLTPIRSTKAISLKSTAEAAADTVIAYDGVTGSVGGVAYVDPTRSPSGAALYITAPKTAPLNKQSPNGPGAITTLDATGAVLSTQYVPKVLPGPAGCINNWGDGTATQYKTNMSSYIVADTAVSTCATPIGQVGESSAPGTNVVDASSVVGIGDLILTDDGKLIAANANDGHLYTGPILATGTGTLTQVATLPSFAADSSWRPYALSNHNGQTLVGFTQIGAASSLDALQFAVASYDNVGNTWKTVMSPASAAGIVVNNPAFSSPSPFASYTLAGSILSGVSIDSAGSLKLTFMSIKEASKTPSAGLGSTPLLTLAADGVDHWGNSLVGAARTDIGTLTTENNLVASFGHVVRSPISNKSVLATEDPGAFNSAGLGWLPDSAPSSGTSEILMMRGGAAVTNDNLWIGSTFPADGTGAVDKYAFGKGAGLGQLSDMASYAEIGDRTWIDTNANGLQDAGEPNLPGVVLEVKDMNGAAIIDPATSAAAVVQTDANGRWTLVIDANVKVQVCITASNYTAGGVFATGQTYAGYVPTLAKQGTDPSIDSNADATKCLLAAGGQSFPAGSRNYTFDAGFVPASAAPQPVSIGDYTWIDVNRNGTQDAGEPPLADVSVTLKDAGGATLGTTTTNASGFYSFTGITPSIACSVTFTKAGFTPTEKTVAAAGATKDSNPDPATGVSTCTAPASGTNSATTPDDPTLDAGFVSIDLTVSKKLISTELLHAGDIATFELTPHNNGPADALSGWSVTDVLPPDLTLVSMTGTGYNCTGATCTSTTGLANGADGGKITVTTRISATATASSSLANMAYIKPAANDVLESNVLAVPDTNTNPANTPTNNDVRVSVVLGPLPATGSRTRGPLTLGLVLFGLGAVMVLVARKPRTLS